MLIKEYPASILRKTAKKVVAFDQGLVITATDMLKTMYLSNGVGLAAPQVGISKRLIVVDCNQKPIILVNPEIVESEGEMYGIEGCLSFPDVFIEVLRASSIKIKYQNLQGKRLELEAHGDLLSRCIQHEIDHLDGKLFIDYKRSKTYSLEDAQKYESRVL